MTLGEPMQDGELSLVPLAETHRRSMAAIEKLGAVAEGTLRKNLVTWISYRRDTADYSFLRQERDAGNAG